jgi:ribonuclease HI
MSTNQSYYVVKKGHKVGIFRTWLECKAATDGYSHPVFKKFATFEEAKAFLNSSSSSSTGGNGSAIPKSSSSASIKLQPKINIQNSLSTVSKSDMDKIKAMTTNIKSSQYSDDLNYNVSGWNIIDDEIYMFTDGSSRKSKDFFNSGVGVYLGYQCTNIKEQYNDKTNNQCELMGLDYAFKLIVRYYRELSTLGKVIKIVSDSEYSIKACTVWLATWKKNNWRTAKGEEVKNRELIESIDASMMRIKVINSQLTDDKKIKVKLIHVNSHQAPDMTDKFKFSIWFGNYVADGLAGDSI